jgi:Zn-dependent protease with chaperone function
VRVAFIVLVFVTLVAGAASALTRTDQQVNALPVHALLTFSPVALADPVTQRRARVIVDYQELTFAVWAIAPIVTFLWLWRSGNAARLRGFLRRRFTAAWAVRAVFGAALGALATIVALPFAFAAYRFASGAGLTHQPLAAWFADEIVRLGVVAFAAAIAVAVVLALVDATRLWYLVFIAGLYVATLVVVAVEPVLFAPLTSGDRPAPAWIVAQGDEMAAALGTSPVPISIAQTSQRNSSLLARSSGLGPFSRIVIGDVLLKRLTPSELRFVLARQYAHLRQGDVLWLALAGVTLFVMSGALAILTSDRIGFRRDDDPLARLALVGTCLGVFALLLYPVYNRYERHLEWHADRMALSATHDPAAGVRLLVRIADDDLIPLCGRRTVRWYFDSRAPIGTRIAAMNGTADPCPR